MATYTENYNLEKPAQSDLYNVDVFNENADKVDEALGDKAENQSLAPIESSATASRNYSVGQQFVYNGLLYEATAAIASGGTITPGSNCARTTVAEELSALNDSLTNFMSVRYQANNAATSYTFDAFHSFGVALVFTHYDVWAVYYDGSSARYSKLTSFKSTYNITSASFSNNKITITFDATAWSGIVVYQ